MGGESATSFQVDLPEGVVRVETYDWGNVALLTFREGFGVVELARGAWELVFPRLVELKRDGVPVGPAHVPGQPWRWTSLPHDSSCRSSVPGGHLHIVPCATRYLLLFVDGLGGCHGVTHGSDVRALQKQAMGWTSAGHERWMIHFRGRRHVLHASSRRDHVAMTRVDRAVVRAIPLATEVPTLRLELEEDGRTEVLAEVPLLLSGGILWSDGSEESHRSPHGQQRSTATAWPRASATPSKRPAPDDGVYTLQARQQLCERLEAFARQRGPGRQMRERVVVCLLHLVDQGVRTIRCRANGPALRATLEGEFGPLHGSTRAFRYVRHDLEIAGILLREGKEFTIPLADLLRINAPGPDTRATPNNDPPQSDAKPTNATPDAGGERGDTRGSDTPTPSEPDDIDAKIQEDIERSGITASNAGVILADGLREFAESGIIDATRVEESVRELMNAFSTLPDKVVQHPAYTRVAFALFRLAETRVGIDKIVLDISPRVEALLRKEPW